MKIKDKNYWINNKYLAKLNENDKLYIRWKKLQSEQAEEHFKKMRNELNNMRKKMQKKYAEKEFEKAKGNSKKTWNIINEIYDKVKKKIQA